MYRLLNGHLNKLYKFQNVTWPEPLHLQKCDAISTKSLLNIYHCSSCIRFQSTNTNPNPISAKKSKKRSKAKKFYYDLLVVTDSVAKQQKTTIKKLTWDDLRLLASTNLNLSELHKLKNHQTTPIYEHSYSNLTVIDPIPNEPEPESKHDVIITELPPADIIKPEPIREDDSLDLLIDNIPVVNSLQAASVEVEEEEDLDLHHATIDQKHPKINITARHEIAAKTLGAYFEVCASKIPKRGLNALIFHNSRSVRCNDKSFPFIQDINVYNSLLKGFAAHGDVLNLEEVISIISDKGVCLNLQSFIAIFECYGRANVREHYLKQIRIYGREALTLGYTFNDILNRGCFLNDEREVVLGFMQLYDPNFIPEYQIPTLQYQNHLVDHLNHPVQLNEPEIRPNNDGIFTDNLIPALKKQLELETKGYISVRSIESQSDTISEETAKYRQVLDDHLKNWEETALKAFNRDLAALSAQRHPLNEEPYFRCIPTKEFITIIVDEAKKIAEGSETYSPTVSHLYKDLGNRVYARYIVLRKQKTGVLEKMMQIHSKYCEQYVSEHQTLDVIPNREVLLNPRQNWQWFEHTFKNIGATLEMDHREWSPSILVTIGKFLYHIVMHDLKVDVNAMRTNSKHKNHLPAFYTIFRAQGRTVKEEVKPHPVLSRLYRASMPETLTFPAFELPMICPPVPWTCTKIGGYLVAPAEVVRLPQQAVSQRERLTEMEAQQLYPSLDALNQLAGVPWRVNEQILDVILNVFRSGGSARLDVPEPPSSLEVPPVITAGMDKGQKFKVFRQKLQFRRKKAEMYSLWCDCLYRLSLANHFRNDIFWLPHNMDFRGRVYPIPPHLNHLGSDLARSMLVFAEARPLGPDGLDWLKLHLINLTGLKKRDSIADRLSYANQLLDLVLDSADSPLTGKMWWAESEEPWQTLACCQEIAKAMRAPNSENYRSYFPIHQDGSCNGLQHYAALGRDSAGAFSVNLCPSQVPQDVYSAVVALVEEQRVKDAENGLEIAKQLDGFVKRKVIKQTIMTTVYGVTRFGARLQIARQLKDLENFPKDNVWSASSYLTTKTFDSLRTMFTSTREIQDWFTDCARLISAVGGQHVEWVTPMGLPIVQPYVRFKPLQTVGVCAGYKPFHMDRFEKPNVMKQKNAFPPNFIHSLDSSHMMLTSLHCERKGITFVSVHDCYWTHASTVGIMNEVCREQFVALHSEPILENLSMFLSDKYSYDSDEFADDGSSTDLTKKKLNRVLRQLPKTGDFDINQVLQSIYFFS